MIKKPKQTFALLLILSLSNILFAQHVRPILKSRPVDYEYLAAPDSLGDRASLKMPSASRANGQVLPYPIIFVHGLNSNSETWNATTNAMDAQYGLNFGGRFDFCLNYDGNYSLANTNYWPTPNADMTIFNGTWYSSDYYYVNFDVGLDGSFHPNGSGYDVKSNQQAIVKQGVALSEAINRVLQLTGRDKVVLMGHSMGGLAAREYLQNPSLWVEPGLQHHVAKLVTTGTPHGGSNEVTGGVILSGVDCQSEAYRDLRTTYSGSNADGVYLFGGLESYSVMDLTFCLASFYNIDVNCNGLSGNNIQGLDQKNLYNDLDYSCIIGECSGCFSSSTTGDGFVSDVSANLNNYYTGLNANLFHYYASATFEIHTDLTSQILQNMEGLDEPDQYNLAYGIDFNTTYEGFVTTQASNNINTPNDFDEYKFIVPSNSNVTADVWNFPSTSDFEARIVNSNYQTVGTAFHASGSLQSISFTQTLNAGTYFLEILGAQAPSIYLYNFELTLSPPSPPVASLSVSNANICSGGCVNFTDHSTNNPDSWLWSFPGGTPATSTSQNPIVCYNTAGNYDVTLTATNAGGNNATTQTNYIHVTGSPNITITSQGPINFCDGGTVVITAPNGYNTYSWSNGTNNTTGITVSYTGYYSVTVSNNNGCFGTSNTIHVAVNPSPTPAITANGPTTFCEGQSVTLSVPTGFNSYSWTNGISTGHTANVTSSGNYNVTVVDNNSCNGTSINTIAVTVDAYLNPSFTTILNGYTVSLSNSIQSGTTYLWDFGDGNGSININPSPHTYTNAGTYLVKLTATNSCGQQTSAQNITVPQSTGIIEAEKKSLKVYPNPANEILYMDLELTEKTELKIYDALGQIVLRQAITKFNKPIAVNIENLANGVYWMKIGDAQAKFVKR